MFARLVLFVLHVSAVAEDKPPELHVAGLGSLRGRSPKQSGEPAAFLGIPYAKSPSGNLRWQPPMAHGPWEGVHDASKLGFACIGAGGTDEESEDCLFLNVYTPWPMAPDTKKLPTMVWIHGGGYAVGSSNQYDRFARAPNRSSVLVTINYRLNAFGFLGASALKRHSRDGSTGNFGLQDQQAALSWVRQHISQFGGDENQVTIFGESAGGNSVLHHLVLSQSRGLFDRAIIESGSYEGTLQQSDAERTFETVLGGTPCRNLASGDQVGCLLRLSVEDIRKAASQSYWVTSVDMGGMTFLWGPVIDGITLSAQPQKLLAHGNHNAAPVIIGSNSDEFSPPAKYASDLTEAQLDNLLADDFGKQHVSMIKRLYAPADYEYPTDTGGYSSWWWRAMRIHTDLFMGCGVRRIAQNLLQGGSRQVYTYSFAHPTRAHLPQDKDFQVAVNAPASDRQGVFARHTAEIPYVFGWTGDFLEGSEAELSFIMKGFWEQFSATSDPSKAGSLWPSLAEGDDPTLVLQTSGAGIHVRRNFHKAVCDFWDAGLHKRRLDEVHV